MKIFAENSGHSGEETIINMLQNIAEQVRQGGTHI